MKTSWKTNFYKFQDVWVEKHILVCLKIHLHVYEVITFILEISEEKNFNGIEIPWCMFLTDVYNFIIQLYALQEKQTLMKTDMDSRFTSESEARYVESSSSTHELRPC